jgi:hypothetical protein
VGVTLGHIRQIIDVCAENDVELIVLVLPTKPDADLTDDREKVAEIMAGLELTEVEAELNVRLGRRLIEALEAWDVAHVDPLEVMRARPEPLYWRKDYHLNPAGHALVAELLLAEVLDIVD